MYDLAIKIHSCRVLRITSIINCRTTSAILILVVLSTYICLLYTSDAADE